MSGSTLDEQTAVRRRRQEKRLGSNGRPRSEMLTRRGRRDSVSSPSPAKDPLTRARAHARLRRTPRWQLCAALPGALRRCPGCMLSAGRSRLLTARRAEARSSKRTSRTPPFLATATADELSAWRASAAPCSGAREGGRRGDQPRPALDGRRRARVGALEASAQALSREVWVYGAQLMC
jgi:hypothetical protein